MALNALEMIDLPSAGGTFHANRVRRALSLAKAAKDAQINIIIDLAARSGIVGARFGRIWMGGRFGKEGFQDGAGHFKQHL
jgi:hypothetical protein